MRERSRATTSTQKHSSEKQRGAIGRPRREKKNDQNDIDVGQKQYRPRPY